MLPKDIEPEVLAPAFPKPRLAKKKKSPSEFPRDARGIQIRSAAQIAAAEMRVAEQKARGHRRNRKDVSDGAF